MFTMVKMQIRGNREDLFGAKNFSFSVHNEVAALDGSTYKVSSRVFYADMAGGLKEDEIESDEWWESNAKRIIYFDQKRNGEILRDDERLNFARRPNSSDNVGHAELDEINGFYEAYSNNELPFVIIVSTAKSYSEDHVIKQELPIEDFNPKREFNLELSTKRSSRCTSPVQSGCVSPSSGLQDNGVFARRAIAEIQKLTLTEENLAKLA
jgi:hypothetical protein